MLTPVFADISSNNGSVDIHSYRQSGHCLIAVKASEGIGYVNPYHRGQVLQAAILHMSVIHYHFAHPDVNTPEAEADHFIRATHGTLGPHDYVCLDQERATPQGWSQDPAWSHRFDKRLRELTWYKTILYASRSVLQLAPADQWLVAPPYRFWDADWSVGPDRAPAGGWVAIRQFTDGVYGPEPHTFTGIGRSDGNIARGSFWQQVLSHQHGG